MSKHFFSLFEEFHTGKHSRTESVSLILNYSIINLSVPLFPYPQNGDNKKHSLS